MNRTFRIRAVAYWILVVSLMAIGVSALTTFGGPFLLVGIALTYFAPDRDRPRVFWPWIMGILGFILGFVLLMPWGCSQPMTTFAAKAIGGENPIVCHSFAGAEYINADGYNPPVEPAIGVGVFLAGLAALGAWSIATDVAQTAQAKRRRSFKVAGTSSTRIA